MTVVQVWKCPKCEGTYGAPIPIIEATCLKHVKGVKMKCVEEIAPTPKARPTAPKKTGVKVVRRMFTGDEI